MPVTFSIGARTASHNGRGIGEHSRSGFYGNGFASESRLVEKDVTVHDPDVGGRKVAHLKMNAIAWNEICGGHQLPAAAISLVEEDRANKALTLLRGRLTTRARVLRDGAAQQIEP